MAEIINKDGSRNWEANILFDNVKRLEQENTELKAENERLKNMFEQISKEHCEINEAYITNTDYLREIKEILLQAMDVKSNAYNHFLKVEQAIDLITKAEEE